MIGSDGFISLAALQWLADQEASFVMLQTEGRYSRALVLSDHPRRSYDELKLSRIRRE